MPKVEHPLSALKEYLPERAFEEVAMYLQHYKVHLTITRKRQTVLGDYRNATKTTNHRISINGNLNKYAFLITLLHELAHLLAFEQFGFTIQAHGSEWKAVYGKLIGVFLKQEIFPLDIKDALAELKFNPAASSCGEESLTRVLRLYDVKKAGVMLIEELPSQAIFMTYDGKVFKKEQRLRKRFKCTEIKTGTVYLFSPVHEVKQL